MEDDSVINEILLFKSKLANMQKGIRELKNNMKFMYTFFDFHNNS